MDNFAKVKYICPKCLYYINGKCEHPGLCVNFNRFKQDKMAYAAEIKALKAEIKKLKKEIDNLKKQIGGEQNAD